MKLQTMSPVLIISTILSFAIVGCGDEKKGVDAAGNCDSGYINAYNEVAASARGVAAYFDSNGQTTVTTQSQLDQLTAALRAMDKKCDAFLANYRGTSCKAYQTSSGTVGATEVSKMETACNNVKSVLSGTASVTTQDSTQASLTETLDISDLNSVSTTSDVETIQPEENTEDGSQ